jgi:hypothetical protein
MRILLLAAMYLIASAIRPASAEDFTGFYAGVNAGYAFGRGEGDERRPGMTDLPDTSVADSGPNTLPPSAQGASRALQARNRSSGGGAGLPR